MAFAAGKLRPAQPGPPGLVTQKILKRAGQEAHPIELSQATKQVLADRVIGKLDARRSSSSQGKGEVENVSVEEDSLSESRSTSGIRQDPILESPSDPIVGVSIKEGPHRHKPPGTHHRNRKHTAEDVLPPVAEGIIRVLQASPYCTVQEVASDVGHVLRKHGAKKSADAFELSMQTAIMSSADPLPTTTGNTLSESETKQRLRILDQMVRAILKHDIDK
ncbi:hypothetical protein FOL47_003741 [Perkinsus chesapeaki]|uniref:Uncharacterized protein n=1 Tax=Perkinsus chesapeaki TaxID=330153 RepID=A0A7J6M7H6_PERCH|nr:hypothetical protein FOL47_003741 [Perkinsus chesapeaki]